MTGVGQYVDRTVHNFNCILHNVYDLVADAATHEYQSLLQVGYFNTGRLITCIEIPAVTTGRHHVDLIRLSSFWQLTYVLHATGCTVSPPSAVYRRLQAS